MPTMAQRSRERGLRGARLHVCVLQHHPRHEADGVAEARVGEHMKHEGSLLVMLLQHTHEHHA
jgi:hypothetical protein